MRLLEIVLVGIIAIDLLRRVWAVAPAWRRWIPVLGLAALLAHLAFEGYRWQMVGVYVLAVGLFLLSLPDWRPGAKGGEAHRSLGATILRVGLGLLLLAILAAPAVLFPVPTPPAPDGPYQVGVMSQMLVDSSRQEIYSGDPTEARRLMIQVWYPVDSCAGKPQAYWMPEAEQVAPAIAGFLDLPGFFLDHLKYVRQPSCEGVAVSQSGQAFPVLLFSHGWSGFRNQTSFLMHHLASHGYVVAALDHSYGALLTVFPDGKVAALNPDALPSGVPDEQYQQAANRLVSQWTEDLAFTLDTLEQMNQPGGLFAGRLDLQRVGVMGHSTGGGAAIEFCGRNPRCTAGLGLDAWMTPVSQEVIEAGVKQPFLLLTSERWSSDKNRILTLGLRFNSPEIYHFSIEGTDHYDFSDLPMLTPLAARLGMKGPLNGQQVIRIINAYSLAFFDQALKDIPTMLLMMPSLEFPEVFFEPGGL